MFTSALKSLSSNISANYQISPNPVVVSGPWKVHDGKKKSTGTTASIFIFDRKFLEPRAGSLGGRSGSSFKKLHDEVVERLKREASNLARLRHPSILQVLEPVEETRGGGLMFATEPITASLAGLLQEEDEQYRATERESKPSNQVMEDTDGRYRRRDLELDELEIQKGLLQVAKGLEFLHESAGLVHGNLNPEAIYINAKSDWKISGLGYAGPADSGETRSSLPPLALSEALYQDPRLPRSVQLNLDYASPDFVMDSIVNVYADMFSLGLVIVTIYNSPHVSPIQTRSNINTYKKLLSSPSTTPSPKNSFLSSRPIPKDLLSQVLPRLVSRRPAQRMSARELQESKYFDNILVSTIRFLESLPAKTPNEKTQFLRGLQRVIPEFPASVLERKVLGALLDEMKDRELLPLILQNVFSIFQKSANGRRIFPEKVIPRLKEVFLDGLSKGPAQERDSKKDAGLMVVLENMKTIAENCSGIELKNEILPLMRLGLDSSTHSVVDTSLKSLPAVLPVLDFSTVKNEVFPPIASTFSKTSSLAIKVRALQAFAVLCGGTSNEAAIDDDDLSGILKDSNTQTPKSAILDKYTVQEKLVPSLKAIKTKEPAVMMAALNVFRQVGAVVDTDFLALEILPILWNFSLGPLLDLQQFGAFMDLVKSLSAKIEREQTKKLRELSSSEASGFGNGTGSSFKAVHEPGQPDVDHTRNDFERLVLGKGATTSNGHEADLWASSSSEAIAVKTQSQVPSFSWSSKPPITTSPQTNNTFRSITPDYSASSAPSLGLTSKQSSAGPQSTPASQPSTIAWNTRNIAGPQPNLQATTSNSSLAAMANMNTRSATSQFSTQSSGYSPFFIPPPPSAPAANLRNGVAGAAGYSTSSSQNTSLNSPPKMHTPQKQGLDKYESLL